MRHHTGLRVDLDIFAENLALIKKRNPNNEILFMIKSDGYGHGMLPLAERAIRDGLVSEFGCATLQEALYLRNHLSKDQFDCYVFSDLCFDEKKRREEYTHNRIIPVIHNLNLLDIYLSDESLRFVPLVLKFNTGMNRLGIDYQDLDKVIERLNQHGRKNIYHLMSHFSSSFLDVKKSKISQAQMERFKEIKKRFSEAGVNVERTSIANSGAIEQDFGLEETHLRPGLMVYGASSMVAPHRNKSWWNGKNISELQTRILSTRAIEKGAPIGYGGHICPQDGLLIMLALGYGDGFATYFEGVNLEIAGHKGQVIGRINMDMTAVLFPMSAAKDLKQDVIVSIWNHNRDSIQSLCDQVNKLAYETYCQISPRVPRDYFPLNL